MSKREVIQRGGKIDTNVLYGQKREKEEEEERQKDGVHKVASFVRKLTMKSVKHNQLISRYMAMNDSLQT